MPRYMTAYVMPATGPDYVAAATEKEDWRELGEIAEDYVWQFAPDKATACAQHFDKLDEWEIDPTKHTYYPQTKAD